MNAICITCGTQFGDSASQPDFCPICTDDRQYVGLEGQQWTTLDDLRRDYKTKIQSEEPGLTSFWMEPKFGIGQRAFLIETPSGNVLWDCISLLEDAAVQRMRLLGGVAAIAISIRTTTRAWWSGAVTLEISRSIFMQTIRNG